MAVGSAWIPLLYLAHGFLRIGSMVLEIERGFDQEVLADVVRSLMAVC